MKQKLTFLIDTEHKDLCLKCPLLYSCGVRCRRRVPRLMRYGCECAKLMKELQDETKTFILSDFANYTTIATLRFSELVTNFKKDKEDLENLALKNECLRVYEDLERFMQTFADLIVETECQRCHLKQLVRKER